MEKFVWECNYTFTYLFKTFLGISFTAAEEAALQKEFTDLATRLAKLPRFSLTAIYLRNIMIKSNKIYFIDFQDARMGPPQYDLVSLVHDSYVKLQRLVDRASDRLLFSISQALQMYGDSGTFHRVFQLQMLQRCFLQHVRRDQRAKKRQPLFKISPPYANKSAKCVERG